MAKKTKSLPRGMYQREGGMYYSRLTGPDGRMVRRALSMDRQTAIMMLNELRKNVELQRMGIVSPAAERQIKTFEELMVRYLKHVSSRDLSEETITAYKRAHKSVVLRNHFVYLQDMTLGKVEEWSREVLDEGMSGQTVNFYVGYIKRALQWALNNGLVRHNILANWIPVRRTEAQFRRDFQPDEIERLFAAEKDPEWRVLWLLFFNTALRRSAGLAVCWEWIDWDARLLRLPLEHNKSRREHEIPLSSALYSALAARRATIENPTGLIFSQVSHNKLRGRLRRICKRAGVDLKGICIHSIRHTVATMIFNNTNGNIKAVQEILGHADPATTMRYLHVTSDDKRRAVDALGFGQKDPGSKGEGSVSQIV